MKNGALGTCLDVLMYTQVLFGDSLSGQVWLDSFLPSFSLLPSISKYLLNDCYILGIMPEFGQ